MSNKQKEREEKEAIAIQRYKSGEKPFMSTFIDEETLTYGYGELSSIGDWEYEIPHSELNKGEAKKVSELESIFIKKILKSE